MCTVRIFVNGEWMLRIQSESKKVSSSSHSRPYLREGLAAAPPRCLFPEPFESDAPESLRFFDHLAMRCVGTSP